MPIQDATLEHRAEERVVSRHGGNRSTSAAISRSPSSWICGGSWLEIGKFASDIACSKLVFTIPYPARSAETTP